MAKSAKGWGIPGRFNVNTDGTDTIACGVCTCKSHKDCATDKMCARLFSNEGDVGMVNALKRLMGKSFPKNWNHSFNDSYKVIMERQEKMSEFAGEAFKKCRPVRVTISVEKR